MPNWCFNKLMVKGKTSEDLQAFIDSVKGEKTDLSLDKLVPCPKELLETTVAGANEKISAKHKENLKKYGYADWHQFRCDQWGTGHDVEAQAHRIDEKRVVYIFDSAWSPPVFWLEKIAPMFPNCEFVLWYLEEMEGFEGIARAHEDEFSDEFYDIETFEDEEAEQDS